MSDLNNAMESYFEGSGRKSLSSFISTNTPLVKNYIRQFNKPADAKKNLENKFKSEYKIKHPCHKRSPSLAVDFDTLWSSTQLDKAIAIETNAVSVEFVKASGSQITKRLKLSQEEEGKENVVPTAATPLVQGQDGEHAKSEEESVSDECISSESNDVEDSLVYVVKSNENEFKSIISSDQNVPAYLQHFKTFQIKAFEKAKSMGLFVDAHLHQILSLYHAILLKKGQSYSGINMTDLYKDILQTYKCDGKINSQTFSKITEEFRDVDIETDRDELKIKLHEIYKQSDKDDRKVIDVLVNLINKLQNKTTLDYDIEEQELINNLVDPILSPILHRPEQNELFIWLDRITNKNYKKRPDAGCALIHERRLVSYSGFAEVKAGYRKKESLSTHEDLLRLSLFGIHEIEENDARCVLVIQVIGDEITVYGCAKHEDGLKVIFEFLKIKIPLSFEELPGFVMKLDDLKKVGQFYQKYCIKGSSTTHQMKRKSSASQSSINLDKIINLHKPKDLKTSVDF